MSINATGNTANIGGIGDILATADTGRIIATIRNTDTAVIGTTTMVMVTGIGITTVGLVTLTDC